MTISNDDNVIDSRDVIARVEELQGELDGLREDLENAESEENRLSLANDLSNWLDDYQDELNDLKKLAEEGANSADDWDYGATLVRDDYFEEHAQELASDLGLVDAKAPWPNNCIDWERAARQLQQDYSSVDFGGVTYWVR